MTTDKTFTINKIPIIIRSVTPVSVKPLYNGLENFIETIKVVYEFQYKDTTLVIEGEDSTIIVKETLEIALNEGSFSDFIKFEDFTEEDFYPLAITAANSSQQILSKIQRIRIRTGLDVEPPKVQTVRIGPQPFKTRTT